MADPAAEAPNPGLIYDLYAGVFRPQIVRLDVADQAAIEALLGRSGVTPDTIVVVYSGLSNLLATFAFWLLKVYGHRDVRLLCARRAFHPCLVGADATARLPGRARGRAVVGRVGQPGRCAHRAIENVRPGAGRTFSIAGYGAASGTQTGAPSSTGPRVMAVCASITSNIRTFTSWTVGSAPIAVTIGPVRKPCAAASSSNR